MQIIVIKEAYTLNSTKYCRSSGASDASGASGASGASAWCFQCRTFLKLSEWNSTWVGAMSSWSWALPLWYRVKKIKVIIDKKKKKNSTYRARKWSAETPVTYFLHQRGALSPTGAGVHSGHTCFQLKCVDLLHLFYAF